MNDKHRKKTVNSFAATGSKKKRHKQVVIEVQEAYSKIRKEKDMESILNLHNIESSKLIDENRKLAIEINNLREENYKCQNQSNLREKRVLASIVKKMKASKNQRSKLGKLVNDISSVKLQESDYNYEKSYLKRSLTARNKDKMQIHKGDGYNCESRFSLNTNEKVFLYFIFFNFYFFLRKSILKKKP